MLRTKPELQGKEMTAKEWCDAMKPLIPFGDRDSLQRLNPRSSHYIEPKGVSN